MSTLLLVLLCQPALAGDRLFVARDDTITAYDADSGAAISGGSVTLGASVVDLERSDGGGVIYALDGYGDVTLVRARDFWTVVSPDPLSSSLDLAVSHDRGSLYGPAGSGLQFLDAAGGGATGSVHLVSGGDLLAVATERGRYVYTWDADSGDVIAWDPPTGVSGVVATLDFDVSTLAVSPYSDIVVAVGPDARHGASLGDPDDPVHVAVYDIGSSRVHRAEIPHAVQPAGVAFSSGNPSKLWVGHDGGVMPLLVTGSGIQLHPSGIGAPWVRDLSATDAGDLYVLYDDRVERHAGGGSAGEAVVSFADEDWRFHLVAVPEPAEPSGLRVFDRDWTVLSLIVQERELRVPWELREGWLTCDDCDEEELAAAYEDAATMLEGVEELSVEEVATLLCKLSGEPEVLARAFLDETLLDLGEE